MVKLRQKLLEEVISAVHIPDVRVVVGPRYGEDAAVIDITGLKYLIVHTDPITGAQEYIGWLAVIVPSNDVAVQGGVPRWLSTTLLLPEGFGEDSIRKIVDQMRQACVELGVTVVGGHTEYAPGLNNVIVVSTCIGTGSRYIPTGGAKPRDYVIMVKSPAIEASIILSTDFKNLLLEKGVDEDTLQKVESWRKDLSLVREALTVHDIVNSMHDPTEGGILEGLYEIAYASKTQIEVWLDRIRIRPEIKKIFDTVGLNPLKSLSSGTLLLTVSPEMLDEAISRLRRLTDEVYIIGRVLEHTEEPKVIVRRQEGGEIVEVVNQQIDDEIMLLWSRISTR